MQVVEVATKVHNPVERGTYAKQEVALEHNTADDLRKVVHEVVRAYSDSSAAQIFLIDESYAVEQESKKEEH